VAGAMGIEGVQKLVKSLDLRIVDPHNDIAELFDAASRRKNGPAQPGALRGAAAAHLVDQYTFEIELARDIVRERGYAQARADDLAMANQFGHHAIYDIHRYREADPGAGARRAGDLRVDTDQPAGAVQQGPAGITRID